MHKAAGVALLLLFGTATPAWSAAQPRVVVGVNEKVTRTYPAILGANPAQKQHNDDLNQPSDPDPATCATLPSCDVVPITVTQPKDLSVFDTFSLRIELRWERTGPTPSDLDLYLWYDPQGEQPAKVAKSSTMPEVVTFPAPTSREYQVVVNNAGGVNQGYMLTLISRYLRGERPFESSDPATPALRPLAPAPPIGDTTLVTSPAALSTTSALDLALDPDLGGLSGTGSAPRIFRDSPTSRRRHRSVSSLAIVVWGAVVPIAVALGSGYAIYRRRPRALTFRAP